MKQIKQKGWLSLVEIEEIKRIVLTRNNIGEQKARRRKSTRG